jgi:hypothetical protein
MSPDTVMTCPVDVTTVTSQVADKAIITEVA